MQVPEAVRERMRKAGGGAAGRKEGVAIAARDARAVVALAFRGRLRNASASSANELALEVVDGFLE